MNSDDSLEALKIKASNEGAILLGNSDDKPESPDRIPEIQPVRVWKLVQIMKSDITMNCITLESAKCRHHELFNGFPLIFNMTYEGGDLQILKTMLDKIDSIKSGHSTYEDESKFIGKLAFDKYIKK